MSKLRVLSGRDLAKVFGRFGFAEVSQRGSHIKLRRVLPDGTRQGLTIPDHGEMDRGTMMSIYRQASRYIAEADLIPWFYTE